MTSHSLGSEEDEAGRGQCATCGRMCAHVSAARPRCPWGEFVWTEAWVCMWVWTWVRWAHLSVWAPIMRPELCTHNAAGREHPHPRRGAGGGFSPEGAAGGRDTGDPLMQDPAPTGPDGGVGGQSSEVSAHMQRRSRYRPRPRGNAHVIQRQLVCDPSLLRTHSGF